MAIFGSRDTSRKITGMSRVATALTLVGAITTLAVAGRPPQRERCRVAGAAGRRRQLRGPRRHDDHQHRTQRGQR